MRRRPDLPAGGATAPPRERGGRSGRKCARARTPERDAAEGRDRESRACASSGPLVRGGSPETNSHRNRSAKKAAAVASTPSAVKKTAAYSAQAIPASQPPSIRTAGAVTRQSTALEASRRPQPVNHPEERPSLEEEDGREQVRIERAAGYESPPRGSGRSRFSRPVARRRVRLRSADRRRDRRHLRRPAQPQRKAPRRGGFREADSSHPVGS
jgi:hypothetical protein